MGQWWSGRDGLQKWAEELERTYDATAQRDGGEGTACRASTASAEGVTKEEVEMVEVGESQGHVETEDERMRKDTKPWQRGAVCDGCCFELWWRYVLK